MLETVKEVLTKEIEIKDVKEVLTKDIDTKPIHDFLEMEVEITRLKEMLATEVKLKEFLLQEVDIKSFFSAKQEEMIMPSEMNVEDEIRTKDPAFVDAAEEVDGIVSKANETEINAEPPKSMLPVYDLGLLGTLRNDQKEILFIYNEIMRFTKEKKYQLAADHLEKLTSRITAHFHMSDKELYTYLKAYVHQIYPKREKAFTELSLEMKNISISIFYSLTQSPNFPINSSNYDAFIPEFRHLGEQLQDRINREEKVLFPMYEKSRELKSIST